MARRPDATMRAEPADPSRRAFLAGVGAAALAAGAATAQDERERERIRRRELEHAADPGMLIDLTKCIGCGACGAACKAENGLAYREDQPALGPDARLASTNYSVVRTAGHSSTGEVRYAKTQCMHCLDPACASACFVKALEKSEAGPVVYDASRCTGCRYCLMACPFGVPAFEWEVTFGNIAKCDLCPERTSRGRPTACSEACPTGAITFGRRGDLLVEAWRRIDADDRYLRHVYGEHEAGGTSVMYLSDVSFAALGFPVGVPDTPLPEYTWQISRLIPPVATGLAIALTALYRRRQRLLAEAGDATEEVEP